MRQFLLEKNIYLHAFMNRSASNMVGRIWKVLSWCIFDPRIELQMDFTCYLWCLCDSAIC